jgi:hypothetical protein
MDVHDLVERICKLRWDSTFRWKALVLAVLERHLKEQGKRLASASYVEDYAMFADAISPDGVDDLPGPTVVNTALFVTDAVYFHDSYASTLLISGEELSLHRQKQLQAQVASPPLRIWTPHDLAPLIRRYADVVFAVLTQYSDPEADVQGVTLRDLKNLTSGSLVAEGRWKTVRSHHHAALTHAHREGDLALFLGAGVSLSAKLPDWNTLLARLMVGVVERNVPNQYQITEKERQELGDQLQNLHLTSPLIAARYITSAIGDSLEESLREILYSPVREQGAGTSPLLASLAELCRKGETGSVHSVVTFNYDDLLEAELRQRDVVHRTIFRDEDVARPTELPVYHVHGFVRREGEGKRSVPIVLSEEQYHALYADPYSWSNIVQLNLLRERTCLLVGLSMVDPNLRRLLNIAARKKTARQHYVILSRVSEEKFKRGLPSGFRKEIADQALAMHHEVEERALAELNLRVVWVEDHPEIPRVLDEIRLGQPAA